MLRIDFLPDYDLLHMIYNFRNMRGILFYIARLLHYRFMLQNCNEPLIFILPLNLFYSTKLICRNSKFHEINALVVRKEDNSKTKIVVNYIGQTKICICPILHGSTLI